MTISEGGWTKKKQMMTIQYKNENVAKKVLQRRKRMRTVVILYGYLYSILVSNKNELIVMVPSVLFGIHAWL